MSKPILFVLPYDRTTFFLKRTINHFQNTQPELVHYFNVRPDEKAHAECLERMKNFEKGNLIFFLGHGRSDLLYGAKSDSFGEFVSSGFEVANPEAVFHKTDFITEANAKVFSGKKVICLSCNSSEKLAKSAVEQGAQVFLGFGEIPTSIEEFNEIGQKGIGQKTVDIMKGQLNLIIRESFDYVLRKNLTFNDMLYMVRFFTNQRIMSILLAGKSIKSRRVLADVLFVFKNGMKVVGNGKLKILG